MDTHLSDEQASHLLAGTLPGDELGALESHLWRCGACRDALRRRTEPADDLPPLPAPGLSDEAAPVIPGYEALTELGRGGMGIVYEARQLQPRRAVALKVLRAGLPADVEARRRFAAEAEALARLQHPGIVQVFEVREAEGRPYFSLELCPGGSLAKRLAGGPLPAVEAAALVEAVARAVAAAHRAGILHRDLKPANVLLAADGMPRVSDFGLAKFLAPEAPQLSRSGHVLGTPAYAAPELIDGAAGPASDIYSLGAILYECLTGRPPFQAATVLETLELVRAREPVPVRQTQPSVPRDLETICLKCLEKAPARRYGSAELLAEDLQRFREGRPITARAVSRPERLWRWARRNPLPAGLAAVLALTLTAGLATALGLWWSAAWHLRQEEAARREAEDNYLACRQLLAEYVAVTRDPRLQTRDARHAQREALLKARAFCEGLAGRRPEDDDTRRALAGICTSLAALDAHDARLEQAREAGETARALWQELRSAAPDDARCRDGLAAALQTLGVVYTRLGRYADAERALREAIALWEQLADDGVSPARALRAGSVARGELSILLDFRWHRHDVTRLYQQRCARLVRFTAGGETAPEVRLDLLWNLTILGQLHLAKDEATAVRYLQQGREVGRRVVRELPDDPLGWYFLALCSQHGAAPEETTRHFARAVALFEEQWRRDPADRTSGRWLSDACGCLGQCYQKAGRQAEARQATRRAVAVLADLAERQPGDLILRMRLFEMQARLACVEKQSGDAAAAATLARQTADRLIQFCDARADDPEALALAGGFVATITAPLRHAGAMDEALRVADRCVRLFEGLARKYPDEPRQALGLSEAWTQRAKTLWGLRRYEETDKALWAALRVADALVRRWPELRELRDERRRRLGRFLEERGRAAEAARLRGES